MPLHQSPSLRSLGWFIKYSFVPADPGKSPETETSTCQAEGSGETRGKAVHSSLVILSRYRELTGETRLGQWHDDMEVFYAFHPQTLFYSEKP